VSGVLIVTCGTLPDAVIREARVAIGEELRLLAAVSAGSIDPEFAFDRKRNQYNSTLLLKRIVERKPPAPDRILGLIAADLYIPMLSFVFGQAQVGGPGAIVSTARLRQEFYRLPPDAQVLADRLRKEVLHELGHTLRLVHCPDPKCVMSLATSVRHVDEKLPRYCESCRVLVDAAQLEKSL
jgi:archaemetzincin